MPSCGGFGFHFGICRCCPLKLLSQSYRFPYHPCMVYLQYLHLPGKYIIHWWSLMYEALKMRMFRFAKGRINLGFPIFFLESWSDLEEFLMNQIRPHRSYCWWKKACTTWDFRNPVNNGINYPINWLPGFLPSAVDIFVVTVDFFVWKMDKNGSLLSVSYDLLER